LGLFFIIYWFIFPGLDIANATGATAATINWNALIQTITAVPGVADCTLTTPAANVAGVLGALWIVGTITISQMA
jgi:hypothetical protein